MGHGRLVDMLDCAGLLACPFCCWSTCMSIMLFRNPNIFSGNVRFLFCVILGQNLEMKANLLLLGDMYGDDSS